MAQYATESIWHFAGYLHLPEMLGIAPIHYSGGLVYTLKGEFARGSHSQNPSVLDLDSEPGEALPNLGLPAEPADAAPNQLQKLLPRMAEIRAGVVVDYEPTLIDVGVKLPFAGPGIGFGDGVIPSIVATYGYGYNPAVVTQSTQINALHDNDVLTGDPSLLPPSIDVAAHVAQAPDTLAGMLQQTSELIPKELLQPFGGAGGIGFASTLAGDNVAPFDPSGSMPAPLEDAQSSTFIDGVKTAATGQTAAEQLAQIKAILDTSTALGPEDENVAAAAPDLPHEVVIANAAAPTDGTAQILETGGNQSINAAVLNDAGQAFGSLIVRGDYHVTNAIVQLNVLHDDDDFKLSTVEAVGTLATANQLQNEASFLADPGHVYGSIASLGGPGALAWNIEYNYGDFYNISLFEQHNLITDNDIAEVTASNSHFTGSLGDNGQLNLSQLLDLGSQYDLIVIGGDYVKLNAIIQVNLLLDDDFGQQFGAGAGSQSADGGGNFLGNDAAIISLGDQQLHDLSQTAELLADAIADSSSTFTYEYAIALPGNGTPTFDVLYIDGDYYDYNVIYQTNTISDADALRQLAQSGDASNKEASGSSGSEAVDQSAQTGANALINAALIVDTGSTSDYQFVGGDVYQTTLLVQANIIGDDNGESGHGAEGDANFHPDVVAAVAALVDATEAGTSDHAATPPNYDAVQTDILSGMLH